MNTPKTSTEQAVIDAVIFGLKTVEVDGETTQHILEEIGMDKQMLRQLIMSASFDEVEELWNEKNELK